MGFNQFLESNLAGGSSQFPSAGNAVHDIARNLLIGSLTRKFPRDNHAVLPQMSDDELIQLADTPAPTLGHGPPRTAPLYKKVNDPVPVPVAVEPASSPSPQPAPPPPASTFAPPPPDPTVSGMSGQMLPPDFFDPDRDNRTKVGQQAIMSSRLADATGGNPRDYQAMDERTVALMLAAEIQKVFPQMTSEEILSGGVDQLLGLSVLAAQQDWQYAPVPQEKPVETRDIAPPTTVQYDDIPDVTATGGTASMLGEDFDPQPPRPPFVSDVNPARPGYDPTTPVINRILTPEESTQVTEALQLIPEQYVKEAEELAMYYRQITFTKTQEEYEAAVAEYERREAEFEKKWDPWIGEVGEGLSWDTLDPGNIWDGIKGAGGTVLDLMDAPRQFQVDKAGDLAYQYVTTGELISSDSFSGQVGDFINNFVQAGSSGLSTLLTAGGLSPDETFYGWMKDPENAKKIRDVYEHGYGTLYVDTNGDGAADAAGAQFVGGRAVWELFVAEMTGWERAALDISFDPTVWGSAITGGLAKGGKGIVTAAQEAELASGITAGTIARQGIGAIMQVPNQIVTAGDKPIEAIIAGIKRGPWGALSDQGVRSTQSENVEDLVQQGIQTAQATSIGGAPPASGAAPNAPGGPPAGTGPTAPGGIAPGSAVPPGGAPPAAGAAPNAPGGPPAGTGPTAPGGPSVGSIAPSPNAPVNPATGLPTTPPTPPERPGGLSGAVYNPIDTSGPILGPAQPTIHGPDIPQIHGPLPERGPSIPDDIVRQQAIDAVPTQHVGGGRIHVGDNSSEIYVRPAKGRDGSTVGYSVVRQTVTDGGATKYVPVSKHTSQQEAIDAAKQLVSDEGKSGVPDIPVASSPDAVSTAPSGGSFAQSISDSLQGVKKASAEGSSVDVPSSGDVTVTSLVPVRDDLPVQTKAQRNTALLNETQSTSQANMSDRTLRDRTAVAAQQIPDQRLRAETQGAIQRVKDEYDPLIDEIGRTRYRNGEFYKKAGDQSIPTHERDLSAAQAYKDITGELPPGTDRSTMKIRPGNATDREGMLADSIERLIYGEPDEVQAAQKYIREAYIEGTGWKSQKDAVTGKVTKTGPRKAIDPEFGERILTETDRLRQKYEELIGERPTSAGDLPPIPEMEQKVAQNPQRIATLTPAEADIQPFSDTGVRAAEATKPAKAKKPKPAAAPSNPQRIGKRTTEYSGGITSMPMADGQLFQQPERGLMAVVRHTDDDFMYNGKLQGGDRYIVTNVDGRVVAHAKTEAKAIAEARRLLGAGDPNLGAVSHGGVLRKAEADFNTRASRYTGDPVPSQIGTLQPELQEMVRRGNMDMDTALALNQEIEVDTIDPISGKTTKGKTTVLNYIAEQYSNGKSIHEISEDLYAKMMDQELKLYALQQPISILKRPASTYRRGASGKAIRAVGRVAGAVPRFFRENVMYNPISGPAATVRDATSNAFYTAGMLNGMDGARILAKEIPVLLKSYDPEAAIEAASRTRQLAGMVKYSAADIEAFADAGITGGKTPLAQQGGEWLGRKLTGGSEIGGKAGRVVGGALSAKAIRDRRVGIDVISRLNIHDFMLARHMGEKRLDFMLGVRKEFLDNADAWGWTIEDVNNAMGWMLSMGGKNHGEIIFSPDDVFNRLTSIGIDPGKAESLSRTWGRLRNEADALARKDVNDVLFSYKQTKADNALSKVLIFSYWQMRAIGNTARIVARNPALFRLGVEMQQYFSETSNHPGLNPWVRGLLKYNSINLWSFFTDPMNALIPYANFRELARGDGREDEFDKAMKMLGVTPWLQFAAGAVGLGDPYQAPNLFGTSAPMSAAVVTTDLIRNYVLPEWFGDTSHMGLSDSIDLPQRFANYSMEEINEMLRDAGVPGVDTTELSQVGTSKIRRVRAIVTQIYMEENGVTLETWDLDENGEVDSADTMAIAEIMATEGTDNPHPILQQALAEASKMAGINRVAQSIIPSGSQMVYMPQADMQAVKAGETIPGQEPPSEYAVDAAHDIADIQVSANPEFTGQVKGSASIGTAESREVYSIYNDLAYSDAHELAQAYGIGASVIIDGVITPLYVIAKMDPEDRIKLADQWAEEGGVTEAYKTHKVEIEKYKEEHPAYANYTNWRDERYKIADDAGIDKVVQTMMGISPAYKKYIDRLRPQDRENPSVVFSAEAYQAWVGNQSNIYAEHDSNKGGSMASLVDWFAMQEAADEGKKGGGKKGGKKTYPNTAAGEIEQLYDLMEEYTSANALYEEAMAAYEEKYPNSTDQAQKSSGNRALDALMGVGDFRSPEDKLADLAEPDKPYTSSKLKDYLTWKENMELARPGADTSIEAYVAWLQAEGLTDYDDEE